MSLLNDHINKKTNIIIDNIVEICNEIEINLNSFSIDEELKIVDSKYSGVHESLKINLDTIKKYAGKFISFIKSMWKKFVTNIRSIVRKLKSTDNEDSAYNNSYIYTAEIQIVDDKFSMIDKKISLYKMKFSFIESIYNIILGIRNFVSNQIHSILSTIKSRFLEYGRIEYFKGRSTASSMQFAGDDAINADEKSLITNLRDMKYKLILNSKDKLKAYNDFLCGEIESAIKESERYKQQDAKMHKDLSYIQDKINAIIDKNIRDNNWTNENIKKYIADQINSIVAYHMKTSRFDTDFGSSLQYLVNIVKIIKENLIKSGIKPTTQQILFQALDDGVLWYNADPSTIEKVIKLRINYNLRTKSIISNIIRKNYEFFKLSELEAQIMSKSLIGTTSGTNYRRILGLLMKFEKSFITAEGNIDFSPIGAGIVYTSSNEEFRKDFYGAHQAFSVAARYNYSIISHGLSISGNRWLMQPIIIDGKEIDDVETAINLIIDKIEQRLDRITNTGKLKPFSIGVFVCNVNNNILSYELEKRIRERNILVTMSDSNLFAIHKIPITKLMQDYLDDGSILIGDYEKNKNAFEDFYNRRDK